MEQILNQNPGLFKYPFKVQELEQNLSLALSKAEEVHKLLLKSGTNCKLASPDSLKKFSSANGFETLQKVILNFSTLQEVMEELDPDTFEETYDFEIAAAQSALSKFGFRLDPEFWNLLDKDDVIEIYGSDMIQKYRSLNFYNKTSYSLLDLVLNEWYVLWERPTYVLNDLLTSANKIVEGQTEKLNLNMEPHLVKEIFNCGNTEPFEPRVLAVKFKYAMPLYKSVGKEVAGLIISSSTKVVSVGDSAYSLNFI